MGGGFYALECSAALVEDKSTKNTLRFENKIYSQQEMAIQQITILLNILFPGIGEASRVPSKPRIPKENEV